MLNVRGVASYGDGDKVASGSSLALLLGSGCVLRERTELQAPFLQRETKTLGVCENKGIVQRDNQYQGAGRREKGALITDLHMSCLYLGY